MMSCVTKAMTQCHESSIGLIQCDLYWQDNVVARVLLEHVGGAFAQSDPRRAVNYLDLSRLGEEGETPASDEIWLTVGAAGEDDKFLTSDSDTYSVATDKLSTAATIAGKFMHSVNNIDWIKMKMLQSGLKHCCV